MNISSSATPHDAGPTARIVLADHNGQARWLLLPAVKTNIAEARVIPVGPKLRSVLALRQHAPYGKVHRPDAYVFGNAAGEPATSVRRHGTWLASARTSNRHFHDLRREFASRLLESSADLHDVQMFLGHAAITTTSRYLQSTPVRLERALARMERSARLRHDPGRPNRKTNQKVAGARTENAGKTVN